jgi:LysR family transcriptional regulator, low CO2-responsive transcriptional regulator
MNVTFRQMRVFNEVVRQGSVQRAAEALHLTSPAVSMQIKEIESQVGLPLFDRTGRRLSLSTAGEYFAVYARRLLGTLKEAEDAMARFKGVESGLLSIGMVSAAKYFLPRLLAQFHAEHPAIEVRLRLGNREQLTALMQANEVDLSVMGRAPKEWPNRAEPFAAHPHVLVTAPDHPFTRAESVPAAALAREGFIVRESGSGTRAALEEYLAAHRLQPMFIMELPSDEAIKQAVMAGLGVSLVSMQTIGLEWNNGLIAAPHVEGLPLMRRWNLVTAASKMLSPAAEAFRYFMLERGEAHLATMFGADNPLD